MKLFVWDNVSGLTNRWHDGGGLVVISSDLESARKLIAKSVPEGGEKEDEPYCEAMFNKPDYTTSVSEAKEEMIFIFPDAGCC